MAEVPKRSPDDEVHDVAKALIECVPGIGPIASHLFSMVVAPPLEKRRAKWMNSVAERLKRLEGTIQDFDLKSLKDNEIFITMLMQATQLAIRNHQDEKLEMLRNAVINTALGINIEESEQIALLRLIEELTPLHMHLLKCLDNAQAYAAARGTKFQNWSSGATSHVIEAAIPEFRRRREVYDRLGRDLETRGLIGNSNFHVTMTVHGMFQSRTTAYGKEFLKLIENPLEQLST
jgi:hypothetical protein